MSDKINIIACHSVGKDTEQFVDVGYSIGIFITGRFLHEGIKLWFIERGLCIFCGSHYCMRRNTALFQAGGFQWGKGTESVHSSGEGRCAGLSCGNCRIRWGYSSGCM